MEIGQTLYFSPMGGFVIPVKVIDIDYWYRTPSGAIMECRGKYLEKTNVPEGSKLINQFVWIDVSVGHSLDILIDPIWETLQDALRECGDKVTKKQAKRRHKKVISVLKKTRNFIISTGNPVAKDLPLLGDRRVYVKR